MDLRSFSFLIAVYNVAAFANTSHDSVDDVTTIIQMIKALQKHVLSLENQQKEIKDQMVDYQESLTEQYHEIQVQLQVDKIGTINNYYGCENSDTTLPTEPPTTNRPPTEPPTTTRPTTEPPKTTIPPTEPPKTTIPPTEPPTTTISPTEPPTTTMPPTEPPTTSRPTEPATTTRPTTEPPTTTMPTTIIEAQDCEELYLNGMTSDGVYTIYVDGTPMNVYCDMTNGGWIILQKRTDDTVDYDRDFVDYEEGIGDASGEHWIGLRQMNLLTESESNHWVVRFDLEDFYNETRWAEYSEFRISAGSDYTLTFDVNSYRGTAGDDPYGFSYHTGMKFSSRDRDQDEYGGNCAVLYGGGCWYRNCLNVLTTGMPYGNPYAIVWYGWKYDLKSAIIKIKRA